MFEINGLSKAPRLLSTGKALAAGAMLSAKLPSGSITTLQARG